MIRPELRALAWRYREVLTGLGIAVLGLWAALGAFGLLSWLGWSAVLLGLALALAGVQRARFHRNGDGPGVVQVTEGQIAYFGPLTGGTVALDLLRELAFDPTGHPPHWVLLQEGAAPLPIPVNALGADALFDVFAQLPGLHTGALLHQLEHPGDRAVTLWSRDRPGLVDLTPKSPQV